MSERPKSRITILKQADSFFEAFDGCMEMKDIRDSGPGWEIGRIAMTPAIVCAAFASELYLKYLVGKDNTKYTHKIKDLFEMLDKEVQREIEGAVNDDMRSVKLPNFEDILPLVSNVFVDWRYLYEQDDEYLKGIYLNFNYFVGFFRSFLGQLKERAHKKANQKL